ncbi:mucin-2-like isoform X7 [Macrosteles quadrilineatus]|uniref:mucin-2-like isoform X7 n=1 Tax=Macrosteles quadrilineatus TaxID=74068 RepID=UPI0023E1FA0F|nr:mucin-2-like isoform X7 [Macrosteles quadrilineatus]
MYSKHKTNANTIRWRCASKAKFNCGGAVSTSREMPYSYLGNYKEHSHPANEISKEVTKVRIKLRETSQIPDMNPSQVLTTGLRETPDEVKAQLGKLSSIQRDLLNRRKKRQHLPSFPYVGSEFEIPPDWAMTVGEDLRPFFIQDSGSSSESANQEVDGQLDGKSTSLSATKAKKLSKKVETQNPGADGGPSTSASVPQFPIPDFSASSTISDLNLSEPSTSADNSQSTPLEPSASVSGTGYTPSESPPIQVPELYESRMYISPTPMLFEEDMPASQDADGESGPTQTTSVADATPEPTESTSTVKVKPIETLQSKDMFGRESEQATENETAKVDISVKSLESAIKRLESVSNKLAATSNFDSYDQFGKYISSVLRGLPKKKVVSLKQKIITEVMQALSQEEGSGAKNTQTSKNRADTDSISKNCANNTPVITLPTVSQPTFGGPVMYAQLLPQVFEPQVPFSTNVANPSIVNVMTANTFKPPDIATIQPSPIISESLGGQTPFSTSQRSRGRPRKRSGPPETYTNKKMAPDDRTALTMASEMKTTSVNPDFTMAPEMNTTSVNSADELNMYQLSSGSQQESHSQDRLQESPQVGEMEGTTNVENLNSSQLEYEIDIEEGNELAKIKLDSNDSFETVLCEGSSGLYIKEEPPEPDSLTTSQAVTSPVNCHLCSERLMSREHLQEHFCSAHSGVNQSQGT